MDKYKSSQESFWAGEFGTDYIKRNKSVELHASNLVLFSRILAKLTKPIDSVIEYGPNIGLNLIALKQLLPACELSGVEINETAFRELSGIENLKAYHSSIFDFKIDYLRDLALSKGLLIHLNPEMITQAYEKLYQSTSKYIILAEYYNPSPVEVSYRGHQGKLFKRDFAGEMLDQYPDLHLIDYGFAYHRDHNFPQDDITWFLLGKQSNSNNQWRL